MCYEIVYIRIHRIPTISLNYTASGQIKIIRLKYPEVRSFEDDSPDPNHH